MMSGMTKRELQASLRECCRDRTRLMLDVCALRAELDEAFPEEPEQEQEAATMTDALREWKRATGAALTESAETERELQGQRNDGTWGTANIEDADQAYGFLAANATYRCAPALAVRPYTPVEAAAHLGRKVRLRVMRGRLGGVTAEGVDVCAGACSRRVSYTALAETGTWDDGSPCGVVEP